MTAQIISGKEVAEKIRTELRPRVEKLKASGVTPGLAAVILGEDPGALSYLKGIAKGCEAVGVMTETFTLPEDVGEGTHFYFLRVKLVGEAPYNFDPAENASAPFTRQSRYPHNLAKARGVYAWTSPVWVSCAGSRVSIKKRRNLSSVRCRYRKKPWDRCTPGSRAPWPTWH